MAFPLIPALITLITNLPKVIEAVRVIKPIKEKVKEVEEKYKFPEGHVVTDQQKKENNETKHNAVLEFILDKLDPYIKQSNLTRKDIDLTISFVNMVVKKWTSTGWWKRRKKR
jgi:hypothetical protein